VFLPFIARAAQKITIPVGTPPFGPIAVTKLHKWASFSFSREDWTDPKSTLYATLEVSIDGTKTWSNQTTWPCSFNGIGNGAFKVLITAIDCLLPPTATHIRGTAIVTGGEVVLTAPPKFSSKP
jgi:hypothetical protein